MQYEPTPGQQVFIQRAIASGRYRSAEEALSDAMHRWEAEERTRIELQAAFEESEADLKAGAFTDYTNDTLPQLADELKREARDMRTRERPR